MKFKKSVLPNGLRVVTVPMRDNPTVTVLVMVEAGSKYESKTENGLSHFLEHMCFKGTTNRPGLSDISRDLDMIGAHYNAFTGQEYTGYYAKADYKHLDTVLDVVSDLYLNPLLPEAEIKKEKGVIIEELNMNLDSPQRTVADVFVELLYGDTPAGRKIVGTKENILRFTREDFVKYRNRLYKAGATTIVVAGNFDEAKLRKQVAKLFKTLPKGSKGRKDKVVEKQTKAQVKLVHKDTDQTHLILGVRGFSMYDKRATILKVMLGVLSGGMSARLFKKLRDEMGVCYYVRAGSDLLTDHGTFEIAAGVNKERVKEVLNVLMAELRRLTTELVTPEELNKVKQYYAGSSRLSLESSDSLAEYFAEMELFGRPLRTLDEKIKEINKVTAKQIMALAKELFVDHSLNLAMIGKVGEEKEYLPILKF